MRSYILLFMLLIIFIPVFTSSLLDLKQKKENDLIQEAEKKVYLTGKFDPAEKEDFILISAQYTLSGNKIYLRKETYEAFSKMQEAADQDEVELKIVSATRNFIYQKNLWNKKWRDLEARPPSQVAWRDLKKYWNTAPRREHPGTIGVRI